MLNTRANAGTYERKGEDIVDESEAAVSQALSKKDKDYKERTSQSNGSLVLYL